MNVISVNPAPGGFANGFGYFCTGCGRFFSVQSDDDGADRAYHCPYCGKDEPLTTAAELLAHCDFNFTDTVNFYGAFPPDEPIPRSRTGATPRQVERIVGCAISDKAKKIPVTVESLAARLGYDRETVAAVFDELHITETGGME
jgi:hypothetical protein